jgi:DNA-binding CsgD family transcriptional regulator
MHEIVGRPWPLVGRAEEVALCARLLSGGDAAGLVIAGAAGVGKTRLASEVLDLARRSGFRVARATATKAARSIPFGAVAHLLPDMHRERAASPAELLRALRAALVDVDDGSRLVFGADDAHLLDAASATLLHQITAMRDAFVIVTLRSGESVPDAVAALSKDEGCEYVELQPLSYEELSKMLEVVVGPIDGPTLHLLWDATRGMPLLVRELVLDGVERGSLVERSGVWRWQGPLVPSRRVRDLIKGRIGDLDRSERDLLDAIALGEPFGRALFEGAAASAADGLVRRGVLEEVREGRRVALRMAHPLYAEAARATMSPTRAFSVQQQLAEAVEATGARRRDDVMRMAVWNLETGKPTDGGSLLRAAQFAAASFDARLAERFARAAEGAGAGFSARLACALAVAGQGRVEEAERMLGELEPEASTDHDRVGVAVARARNLAALRRGDEAVAIVQRANGAVTDANARRELAVLRAVVEFRRGRVADAAQLLRVVAADRDVDVAVGLHAAGLSAFAAALAGQPLVGLATVEPWRERVDRVPGDMPAVSVFRQGRVVSLTVAGRLADANSAALDYYNNALRARDAVSTAARAMDLGVISLVEGRLQSALRWLRESAVLYEDFDPEGSRPWPLALAAQAAGQLGDDATAGSLVAAASAAAARWGAAAEASIVLGRAWLAGSEGAMTGARRLANESAAIAKSLGQLALEAMALHDLARLGDAAHANALFGDVAPRVEGPLLNGFAAHAAALAARDAAALERCSDSFVELGALLYAAEAAAAAAAAHAEEGREASVRAASARAAALREQCERAATPLLSISPAAAELTPREREIAALAAAGLSSAAIAARLVLSVRTVDSHLQHAYRKLGVSRRGDLANALSPQLSGHHTP